MNKYKQIYDKILSAKDLTKELNLSEYVLNKINEIFNNTVSYKNFYNENDESVYFLNNVKFDNWGYNNEKILSYTYTNRYLKSSDNIELEYNKLELITTEINLYLLENKIIKYIKNFPFQIYFYLNQKKKFNNRKISIGIEFILIDDKVRNYLPYKEGSIVKYDYQIWTLKLISLTSITKELIYHLYSKSNKEIINLTNKIKYVDDLNKKIKGLKTIDKKIDNKIYLNLKNDIIDFFIQNEELFGKNFRNKFNELNSLHYYYDYDFQNIQVIGTTLYFTIEFYNKNYYLFFEEKYKNDYCIEDSIKNIISEKINNLSKIYVSSAYNSGNFNDDINRFYNVKIININNLKKLIKNGFKK